MMTVKRLGCGGKGVFLSWKLSEVQTRRIVGYSKVCLIDYTTPIHQSHVPKITIFRFYASCCLLVGLRDQVVIANGTNDPGMYDRSQFMVFGSPISDTL